MQNLTHMLGQYFSQTESMILSQFFKHNSNNPFVVDACGQTERLINIQTFPAGRTVSLKGQYEPGFVVMLITESSRRLLPIELARLNDLRPANRFYATNEAVA